MKRSELIIGSIIISLIISAILGFGMPLISNGAIGIKDSLMIALICMPVLFAVFIIAIRAAVKKQEERIKSAKKSIGQMEFEEAKREQRRAQEAQALSIKQQACNHEFVTVGVTHPYNTGQAFRTAKCKTCGKVIEEDYGWDDNW